MSNAEALERARKLWGPLGWAEIEDGEFRVGDNMISMMRRPDETAAMLEDRSRWYRGSSTESWEAAFAQAAESSRR